MIVAVGPFAASFAIAFAFQMEPGQAVLQSLIAFALVAVFCNLLIGWSSDEELASELERLLDEMPAARLAWEEKRAKARADKLRARENRQVSTVESRAMTVTEAPSDEHGAIVTPTGPKKCPFCAELILAEAVKCKHCGEILGPMLPSVRRRGGAGMVHVHVNSQGKSGGTAAVLEIVFGLFLQTFGIGHMYVGNIGLGMMLMFGYWIFLAANAALAFLTCGVWLPIAMILVPACWFLAIVVSPLLAANSVSQP